MRDTERAARKLCSKPSPHEVLASHEAFSVTKHQGESLMKQFTLLMVILGLAATGCAQNRLLTRLTTRKSADSQLARSQSNPRLTPFGSKNKSNASGVQLAAFDGGGCDSGCCGDGSRSCDSGKCGRGGRCKRACSACAGRGCAIGSGCNPHAGGYPEPRNFNPSPPTGQVAYPYYTVRGPRDFLSNNPPSIGPY